MVEPALQREALASLASSQQLLARSRSGVHEEAVDVHVAQRPAAQQLVDQHGVIAPGLLQQSAQQLQHSRVARPALVGDSHGLTGGEVPPQRREAVPAAGSIEWVSCASVTTLSMSVT